MKLKVTHSVRPCAARVRRTNSAANLLRRQRGQRNRRHARQRDRWNGIEAAQAEHLLDQIALRFDLGATICRLGSDRGIQRFSLIQHDRCRDIVAPGRHRNGDALGVTALHREAETLQRRDRFIRWNVGAAEPGDALEPQRRGALPCGWRAGFGDLARFAAAQFQDHRGGGLHRVGHQRGVDAALEALARVRDDVVATTSQRDADGIKHRALDKHRVVVASQPVASPPITPAIDCTPAASAIAQSSAATV